ncbi:MAG TPA: hypothetical protein PLL26_04020 [Candidatus Dojkabacteria bacterium]|nr:hypothetical protein [Candidatus Dojkabacteria bacterium]
MYIAIASVVIATIVGFIALLSENRLKSKGIFRVEQESIIFLDIIEQEIRSSDTVVLPEVGTENQSLELSNGRRIYVENNDIFLWDGTEAIKLNSNALDITGLTFANNSRDGEYVISVQISVNYGEGLPSRLGYSKTINSTFYIPKY